MSFMRADSQAAWERGNPDILGGPLNFFFGDGDAEKAGDNLSRIAIGNVKNNHPWLYYVYREWRTAEADVKGWKVPAPKKSNLTEVPEPPSGGETIAALRPPPRLNTKDCGFGKGPEPFPPVYVTEKWDGTTMQVRRMEDSRGRREGLERPPPRLNTKDCGFGKGPEPFPPVYVTEKWDGTTMQVEGIPEEQQQDDKAPRGAPKVLAEPQKNRTF
ncbi:hypothetical protein AK812_SmicGene24668 [Symbiodinium microadriaticum]|uniref:Uncharacterized protein n=1 Tax=Symbiodinium microadriaticum TaxID=2951 RepID=A0A1Q9DE57_SYMMI|nr:hypothetical protein AK812_SmicGene24668 [Symbiodinium microadriaticum]